jgi:ADP-ribose pyrophosphatase
MVWQKTNSTLITEDWFFRFEKIRFERTDTGKVIDPYYLFYCNDWVNAFALTEDGQAIMLHQFRHGVSEIILELPGGVMDPGETDPEAAIRRELLEETGYAFEKVELLASVFPNPALQNNRCYCFLATGGRLVQAQELDENEELEVVLMPVADVKTALAQNKIPQAIHLSTLYYALEKIGTNF